MWSVKLRRAYGTLSRGVTTAGQSSVSAKPIVTQWTTTLLIRASQKTPTKLLHADISVQFDLSLCFSVKVDDIKNENENLTLLMFERLIFEL